ncbi:TPA: phage terminase small subunit [Klebsiella variicola]|uniref:phage terminase small subunit n=1 Tax=Klebsiella pneumoniae complex TaxID=3390273 RepID=UPI0015A7482C|nr:MULTISPECIES: phage terminase small subunit [Klebsiella]HBQ5559694.1 terminase [Klebsiella variicola]MDH1963275.1 phage terminase small subunit [Klebsiella quasipneumoniae]MDV0906652.1 phage terminase small subunit [Klebsiella variicola subsp. variicola]HCB0736430.1 terminase [Klebsiella variicola subsp. variicola]HCF8601108.1 terminase [Klebsiella variicola subsp. variicola]
MLTPAQKHFQRVMAERHGKTDEQSDTARTAHEQIMHRLRMDQSALKRVQSDQAKAAMKRQLLPHYEGWIEGTLDGDSGRQDEVIVTLMVWAIDAGDYALAVRIGRYVVTHGLLMPDRFNRTAATVLVDEICDPILVQVKADETTDVTPYLVVLDEVAEFTAGSDMPDVVRAKLCKVRAFALRNGTTEEQTTALELLRQALKLDAGAGVKKEIDRLARVVKKAAAAAAGTDGCDNTDSTDGAEGTGDMAGDTAADGVGEAAASSDPAVAASVTATKATRKSTTRKPAVRKTTAKKAPAVKK